MLATNPYSPTSAKVLAAQDPESRMANIRQKLSEQLEMQFSLPPHYSWSAPLSAVLSAGQIADLVGLLVHIYPFVSEAALAHCRTLDDFRLAIFQRVGG